MIDPSYLLVQQTNAESEWLNVMNIHYSIRVMAQVKTRAQIVSLMGVLSLSRALSTIVGVQLPCFPSRPIKFNWNELVAGESPGVHVVPSVEEHSPLSLLVARRAQRNDRVRANGIVTLIDKQQISTEQEPARIGEVDASRDLLEA